MRCTVLDYTLAYKGLYVGCFIQVRYSEALKKRRPVTLHVNYHANKQERLEAAEKYWLEGDDTELMKFTERS